MMHSATGGQGSTNGRNAKGQFTKGTSGNPNGRPTKVVVLHRNLAACLAEAMMTKVAVLDAAGKRRLIPAIHAAALRLVEQLPTMDINQVLRALQWFEKLNVFGEMWQLAGGPSQELTREQLEERIMARIAEFKRHQEARSSRSPKPEQPEP